jgi:hypothetical protein
MRTSRTTFAARPILLAVLAALFAAAILPAAAGAAPKSLKTGISDFHPNEPAAFANVRATGSTLALGRVQWYLIAPEEKPANWNPEDPGDPNYDWSYIDTWVTNAVAAGLTPVLQIFGAPPWAQGCVATDTPEHALCRPDPSALAAFAKAAVRRFSGSYGGLPRVRYWEGMNEPNLSLYFQPQVEKGRVVSPGLYRVVQNAFYSAVKSVDPSALVMLAGLAPIENLPYSPGPMKFTRLLLCMTGGNHPRPTSGNCGGGVHFDIFDIHPYTTGGPTHKGGPNDVEMGDLAKIQNLIAAADRAGRIKGAFKRTPLWITEFSWDSKPPDPGGLSMRIGKQWIAEALYQAWLHNVQIFMWYSLEDQMHDPAVPYPNSLESGLYFWAPTIAAEKPKPTMYAFRFPFVAFRKSSGLKYWGRTPNSRGGRVVLLARHGKNWRRIGAARANAVGIFQGFVRTAYGKNKKGAVIAKYQGGSSPAFPMRRVGDFYQPPFG